MHFQISFEGRLIHRLTQSLRSPLTHQRVEWRHAPEEGASPVALFDQHVGGPNENGTPPRGPNFIKVFRFAKAFHLGVSQGST